MRKYYPSKHCAKECDGANCYDTKELRVFEGKDFLVWVSHCGKRSTLSCFPSRPSPESREYGRA